jgi:hypothetical protein
VARDVFVSYSQPDRDCAFELTQRLEEAGFAVWIAPRDVSPAAEWAAEIIDAISAARIMVLVFSASSNSSAQVRREVEHAVHKDVPILPFRLEEVSPSRSLEYFLSSQQWLDGFPSPRTPHYERLCGYLRQRLGEAPEQTLRPQARADRRIKRVSAEELHTLEARLARLVGPIASVLVDRAADTGDNFLELERRLAAELDSPEDQRRFLRSRP